MGKGTAAFAIDFEKEIAGTKVQGVHYRSGLL
jgi:hypothetical protein